jgi:hypothetical protein
MPQSPSTPLPPLAFQNYPVDVRLRIYTTEGRYELEVDIRDWGAARYDIEMTEDDMGELNAMLQEAVGVVAQNSAPGRDANTAATVRAASDQPGGSGVAAPTDAVTGLRELAEVGHYAFSKIFSPEARQALSALFQSGERLVIQVSAEDFSVPWELVFGASLTAPLSFEDFWGMKHIISRIIVQRDRPGAFASPSITTSPPTVGLLTNTSLANVATREIPFFQQLANGGKIALDILRPLDPGQQGAEFAALKGFCATRFDFAHLACHARYNPQRPSKSALLLSDGFEVTLMDMENYAIVLSGHPVVVLNACETGNLNPLYSAHFAAAFLKHGALGVVATECPVPDVFAADFAQYLYERLLEGTPLGESLLSARRYFLETAHNPAGLLYAMYGSPSIRLVA